MQLALLIQMVSVAEAVSELTQQKRHAQVPFVQQQIIALRELAKSASEKANIGPEAAALGFVLTSNMLAGFALELGLKLFFMTYCAKGAPRAHLLSDLFAALPEQVRNDIRDTYASGYGAKPPIKMFGFMTSPTTPANPESGDGKSYQDADALFESASDTFVRSRYFFENIDGVGWTIFDHPIDYMLTMSQVLEIVYAEYAKYGGWGAQIPKS